MSDLSGAETGGSGRLAAGEETPPPHPPHHGHDHHPHEPAAAAEPAAVPPPPASPPPASVAEEKPEEEPAGKTRKEAPDPLLDEVIFKRDLDEVHLLIDFISGRPDKNLDCLELPDPRKKKKKNRPALLPPGESMRRIATLRFPPSPTPRIKSEDAALLLLAKDRLTALADPARGLTIAYTSMFVGATGHRGGLVLGRRGTEPGGQARRDYRLELARAAFPGLAGHARAFKWIFWCLVAFTFVWLFLAALTYWDVALGSSIVQSLDQYRKDVAGVYQSTPDFDQRTCTGPAPPPTGQPGAAAVRNNGQLCHQWLVAQTGYRGKKGDLSRLTSCADIPLPDLTSLGVPGIVPRGSTAPSWTEWLHVIRWPFILCDDKAASDPPLPGSIDDEVDPSIGLVLAVFSSHVLPVMFGLLGALIAMIRAIQVRIRDSELAPRDLVMTLVGLPMGLVAGFAVGLFFGSGSGNDQAAVAATNVTLTAGALGFLAGYGAQSFFRFLDTTLSRLFTAPDPAASASAQPHPIVRPPSPAPH